MGRGWKIAIGVVLALIALLAINALLVDGETKSAQVTVPGGKILDLPDGKLQVVDKGPPSAPPIVLVHCFTCAIDWWDGMVPILEKTHRVVAVDLLGFGGSEKPGSGYSIEDEAGIVAQALEKLHIDHATVAGHSLGGTVATALAEESPRLVRRLVIVDQAPDSSYESNGLPFTATLTFLPMIGEGLWRVTPDFAIKDGLGVAFAPGYDVPERFVSDFRRMTYTSYTEAPQAENDYSGAVPLDRRIARSGVPLLAIFGADEQLYDPQKALAAYSRVPGAETELIAGAGHSPNVEKPAQTAQLLRAFAKSPREALGSRPRGESVRGQQPQRSTEISPPKRASGVRSATGDQ